MVKREELRRRFWPHEVFVDFDNNLNTAIARLREALHDSAGHPRFIETLPKRGYRFLASVSESAPAERSTREARARIVVLPFVNLSGDPSQEYISDAMTDEMITELAAVAPERLTVIARTTAMHYKGSDKDVTSIGRELGLDFLVEGGMRRAEDRIVMTVQLIRVKDQAHLWARRYDAALSGIFTTSNSIAREIAHRLEIPASTGAGKPPSTKEPTISIFKPATTSTRRLRPALRRPRGFSRKRSPGPRVCAGARRNRGDLLDPGLSGIRAAERRILNRDFSRPSRARDRRHAGGNTCPPGHVSQGARLRLERGPPRDGVRAGTEPGLANCPVAVCDQRAAAARTRARSRRRTRPHSGGGPSLLAGPVLACGDAWPRPAIRARS